MVECQLHDRGSSWLLVVGERELRFDRAEAFRRQVFGLLEEDTRHLAIDMAAVTFVDSTALSTFVAAHNRLQSLGQRFALCAVTAQVHKILRLTALDGYLSLLPSPEAFSALLGRRD